MSINIGIIGLAKSGKTTVFNALTRGKAGTGTYSAESLTAHVGMTKVPERRLKVLSDMLHPKKVVPAEVTYIDIGATVKSLVKDKIGGELLNRLSTVDALLNIVRAFKDESIPHPEGALDVERDIGAMDLELVFSDLAIIERRLERVETSLKGAKPPERQTLLHEQQTLLKLKGELEKDTPVRDLKLTPEETKAIAHFQLLTAKPMLIVVNIGEDQIPQIASLETDLNSRYSRGGRRVMALCGKLEMELTQLDDAAAEEFRATYGIKESGLDRIIMQSYELLGLISFFSIASGEVRAWTIPRGTTTVKAAGKIHTDMERGFIKAEVISFNDLVKSGSLAEARKKGLLRLEGKEHTVQDGDVITFLFNV